MIKTKNNTSHLLAPDFLKDFKSYKPQHEWFLASAYVLDGVKGDINTFWSEEAPTVVAKNHRAITDAIDGLETYGGRIDAFMAAEYNLGLLRAQEVQEGVFDLCHQIADYLRDMLALVEKYYEFGFFDSFDTLFEAAETFASLTFDTSSYNYDTKGSHACTGDTEFALVLVCYYYYINELFLPRVYKEKTNEEFNLGYQNIAYGLYGQLLRFFYVNDDRPWLATNDTSSETIAVTNESNVSGQSDCSHRNYEILDYSGFLFCANCGDEVDRDGNFVVDVYAEIDAVRNSEVSLPADFDAFTDEEYETFFDHY